MTDSVAIQNQGNKLCVTRGGQVHVESTGQVLVENGGVLTLGSQSELSIQQLCRVSWPFVEVSADLTLTDQDSGNTYLIKAADVTITLPSTAAGLRFCFLVHTVSASTGLSLSPAATDAIHGNNLTSAD